MANSKLSDILGFLLPKKKPTPEGVSSTNTFNPSAAGQVLGAPAYRDHLNDILTTRVQGDSKTLIKEMMKFDPDVSAATNAYLTVANQFIKYSVFNMDGELDTEGQKQLLQLIQFMTGRNDYTLGFQTNKSIYAIIDDMRYMILMRGAVGAELVLNKTFLPQEIRLVDPVSLEWREASPGQYKPEQKVSGAPKNISLDVPTFFMSWFRKDPTEIYGYSPFVSVINTVAARQQVVNDLYRIMQRTGYPRMHIKVLEEVLQKAAPQEAKVDPEKMRTFVRDRLTEIKNQINTMQADDIFVSTDAVEGDMLNGDAPGMSIDVSAVIDVLNSQNQAALKTMATLIGRGTQGVNTASVEAIIFAMNADALNEPIAEILGNTFTLMLRLQGFDGYVDVEFEKVELRPQLELEPQKALKQARYLELLSLGIISDHQFHMEMFGTPKPDNIEELSGTGFHGAPAGGVDPAEVSPNNDPMGRSVTPEGGKAIGGNAVQKKKKATIVKKPAKK